MFARNLSRLGILAAAMLASTAALAQVSDDLVKIGVLTDMNGPASTPTDIQSDAIEVTAGYFDLSDESEAAWLVPTEVFTSTFWLYTNGVKLRVSVGIPSAVPAPIP